MSFLSRTVPLIALLLLCAGAFSQDAPPQQQPTEPNSASVRKVGGSVLPPKVLSMADPEYSEDARRKKINGTVLVGLVVDASGMPEHVHVIRGVGYGLDENAVVAVSSYRFRPATENGVPVPVEITVQVRYFIRP